MRRSRKRIAAWIAVFAIAFNTLWSSVLQARPGHADLPFEICTASGIVLPASSDELPPAHGLTHCAACGFASAEVALPSSAVGVLPRSVDAARAVPSSQAFPPAASPTLRPRPRSPPVLS